MSHSIGIIGGADGPTAIFVTGDPLSTILAALLAAAILIFFMKYLRKK